MEKIYRLAIHDGAITLGVSLHEDMTKLISVSQRQDAAAGTQTAEPLVMLTACLFSFVVGEHEMRPSGTCHLPPSMENIANFEKFKQKKTRHKYEKNTVLRGILAGT